MSSACHEARDVRKPDATEDTSASLLARPARSIVLSYGLIDSIGP
jgi:hypothetical protein